MNQILLIYFVMGVAVTVALLTAVWAGASHGHWFVRAGAACAVLVALYPIRALEPIVWLGGAMPIAAWIGRIIWRRSAPASTASHATSTAASRFHFRLANVFPAVLLAGILSALAAGILRDRPALNWREGALAGVATATVLASLWVSRARRWRRVAAFIALVGCLAGGLWLCVTILPVMSPYAMIVQGGTMANRFAASFAFLGTCAGLTMMAAIVAQLVHHPNRFLGWAARSLGVVILLAFLLPAAIVYVLMLQGPRVPSSEYGPENCYPKILALARKATDQDDADTPSQPRSSGPVVTAATRRQQLLADALRELSTPGHVDYDNQRDGHPDYVQDVLRDVQALRGFGRMLDGETSGASLIGDFDKASEYAIGNVQLGNTVSRGGIGIHSLVGVAIESVGMHGLSQMRSELTMARAKEVICELERIRSTREPVATTLARDAAYADRAFDWAARFEIASANLLNLEGGSASLNIAGRTATRRRDAMLELLAADLAIRLFRDKYGMPPSCLDDLVPEFLCQPPIDPYCGDQIRLRFVMGEPIVYCVGEDGRDDGGRFGSFADLAAQSGFDFDLDIGAR